MLHEARQPGTDICGNEVELEQMTIKDGIAEIPIGGVIGMNLKPFQRGSGAVDVADISAAIIGTWTNGTDVVTATIPAARFDDFDFGCEEFALEQSLSGVIEYDGTNSPVTLAYTTSEATP